MTVQVRSFREDRSFFDPDIVEQFHQFADVDMRCSYR
jgi:hypothetical protein